MVCSRGRKLCDDSKYRHADLGNDIVLIITETLKVNPSSLSAGTKLIEGGLALGSLQLIELIVEIERRFGISLDGELLAIENFNTVRTLSDTVARTVRAQ